MNDDGQELSSKTQDQHNAELSKEAQKTPPASRTSVVHHSKLFIIIVIIIVICKIDILVTFFL